MGGMINLEWLRTFKTIYETGSMTHAARLLFISQPGVSLHLKSLEEHVGYKLFQRMHRRLKPTERAKLLYNAVSDALGSLEEVEKNFQSCAQKDLPSLTIGMCYETFQETLEKHLPHLPFNLILEFGEYQGLLQKLSQGVVDLVVTHHRLENKDILYEPVSMEIIVLLAGKGTDESGFKKALSENDNAGLLSWLKAQKWYGITGDNEHLRRFWQQNFNGLPDFRPNFIVPNIHSIVRSLAAGPGLGVAPDFLCQRALAEKKVKILWKGFKPLNNYLYLAKPKKPFYPTQMGEIEKILKKELPPLPA